jgi:hypothetical protein
MIYELKTAKEEQETKRHAKEIPWKRTHAIVGSTRQPI